MPANNAGAQVASTSERAMETRANKTSNTIQNATVDDPNVRPQKLKSSDILHRLSLIIVILGLYVVLRNMTRTPTTDINRAQYTDSIFIPFIHELSTKYVPMVRCTIEGRKLEMPVDTGSGILLCGAPLLPNITATGTPAYHFFTSSKILYVGRLVKLSVDFHGEASTSATANIPVLVVDKSWKCPWYNPMRDQFECPTGSNGERPEERDTSKITYMGVGFGRNDPKDGMPFAVPDLNMFLNIDAINGLPVRRDSMRTGYILSTQGVQLGLTQENTKGFAWTILQPGIGHAADPRDWAMTSMCFSINGHGNDCGRALIDSGIPQMYIRAEEGVSIPSIIIRNPDKKSRARFVRRVKSGTKITIGLPSLDASTLSYSFVVGENSSIEPSYVVPTKPTSTPFVNTGRNFLFGYSVAFDAIGGRFGFHAVGSPRPSL